MVWFGDGGLSGAVATRDYWVNSDNEMVVHPPRAPSGLDQGVFISIYRGGHGTSHLPCTLVVACSGGVFYYQSPSTVFPRVDTGPIDVDYPDHALSLVGGQDLDGQNCPGSAPSGTSGLAYSASASITGGPISFTGTPQTSVNTVISSLQVPLRVEVENPVTINVSLNGSISGCHAIPLGLSVPGVGGLEMLIGGNISGSYSVTVTLHKGSFVLNTGFVPGQLLGASIPDEGQDCVDEDGAKSECLTVDHSLSLSGSVFLSPLWLHAGFEVEDVFSFSAGAGLSIAATAQTTTERPFDYSVCLGATSSVAINAFGSYEYTHNGRIWGPHLLAGNGELCPLGATEQGPGEVAVGLESDAPDGVAIGTPVTYTATLEPGDATGTVTFADGAVVVEDCEEVPVVDGSATCEQTYDAAGTHSILASYGGDDAYGSAYSTEPLLQEVAAAPLPVIADLPTSGTYGGGFTATVADGGDAGVSVSSATTDVCAVGTDGLTVSYVSSGTCRLTAHAGDVAGAEQTVEVARAPLTVLASGGRSVYGSAPVVRPLYRGLVGGDAAPASVPTCTTTATVRSHAGTAWPTTCTGPAEDAHYAITYQRGKVVVDRAALTVVAPSPVVAFGTAPAALAPQYAGFVNGQGPAVLTSAARCSTTARATSPVGSYPSSCTGVSARDYLPVYLPGQVQVKAGAPTVTLVQPAQGAVYRRGQAVVAQFSCAPGAGATVGLVHRHRGQRQPAAHRHPRRPDLHGHGRRVRRAADRGAADVHRLVAAATSSRRRPGSGPGAACRLRTADRCAHRALHGGRRSGCATDAPPATPTPGRPERDSSLSPERPSPARPGALWPRRRPRGRLLGCRSCLRPRPATPPSTGSPSTSATCATSRRGRAVPSGEGRRRPTPPSTGST